MDLIIRSTNRPAETAYSRTKTPTCWAKETARREAGETQVISGAELEHQQLREWDNRVPWGRSANEERSVYRELQRDYSLAWLQAEVLTVQQVRERCRIHPKLCLGHRGHELPLGQIVC